jgi:methyltransferase (TIGR00027 family)
MTSLLTRGASDVVPLRTRAIDHALLGAIARGVDRLVILGAGFDGRALRLPELTRVTVREVDHPATQLMKCARLAALLPAQQRCRELIFVPVNFANDDLGESLLGSGHEPEHPTFWIWEGVTMYLPRQVTQETLRTVRRLSAPGSQLALTYSDPETQQRIMPRVLGLLARSRAEPYVRHYVPHEMAELLIEAGFEAPVDSSATEWAASYGDFPRFVSVLPWEHLAVASVL